MKFKYYIENIIQIHICEPCQTLYGLYIYGHGHIHAHTHVCKKVKITTKTTAKKRKEKKRKQNERRQDERVQNEKKLKTGFGI